MQLDELKKSMSVLDQVLAKTPIEINIDERASEVAQKKILKIYRKGAVSAGALAIVYLMLWIGNVSPQAFPVHLRAFLVIYFAAAAVWYMYLYFRLRGINIGNLTPVRLFSETTTLKLLTLTGEIVFGVGLAVFFTMFLTNLLATANLLAFWLCITTLILSVVLGGLYLWPRYIRLFRDLNTIKD